MEPTEAQTSRLVNLQYQLALLVGQELRLLPMLRHFFPPALKALGCRAAHVWLSGDGLAPPELRYSYPARDSSVWQDDPRFAGTTTALRESPGRPQMLQIDHHTYLYLMPLQSIGRCVLVREGEPIDPVLIEAIRPIFDRLANACRASLDHERIEHMQAMAAAGERRLRTVLETIGEVIFQTDDDGELTFLNPAWQRVSGMEVEHCLGRRLIDFLAVEDETTFREAFRCALDTGQESPRLEARLEASDGSFRWVAIRLRPSHQDSSDSGVTGTLIDVTDLKLADRLKREFTSTVSHELRTPLTSIAGAIGLLKGSAAGALPEVARNLVAIADKNCQRLQTLIDDLLDMEKLIVGKVKFAFEDLALRPLLEQALSDHQPFAETHGVRLTLADCPLQARVRTAAGRFQQVLSNLLSNAVKFSPEGGEVTVTAQALDQTVRVEVRDSGPGIADDFQAQVFERFAKADASDSRRLGGTGLGLAISRELVEQMHGRIGFESTAGAGATFWFELPAVSSA
ncbi:MAG: PAS domain S-box protein [Gammaproteobacteria bacterium]|nr:PAS domain S-box protein [Gammaproteobacteria bacterium]